MSQHPRAHPTSPSTAAPKHRRLLPATLILAAGVLAATLILISAARDSVPPPNSQTAPAGQYDTPTRTPDDPANAQPWTPDGR